MRMTTNTLPLPHRTSEGPKGGSSLKQQRLESAPLGDYINNREEEEEREGGRERKYLEGGGR